MRRNRRQRTRTTPVNTTPFCRPLDCPVVHNSYCSKQPKENTYGHIIKLNSINKYQSKQTESWRDSIQNMTGVRSLDDDDDSCNLEDEKRRERREEEVEVAKWKWRRVTTRGAGSSAWHHHWSAHRCTRRSRRARGWPLAPSRAHNTIVS